MMQSQEVSNNRNKCLMKKLRTHKEVLEIEKEIKLIEKTNYFNDLSYIDGLKDIISWIQCYDHPFNDVLYDISCISSDRKDLLLL